VKLLSGSGWREARVQPAKWRRAAMFCISRAGSAQGERKEREKRESETNILDFLQLGNALPCARLLPRFLLLLMLLVPMLRLVEVHRRSEVYWRWKRRERVEEG
jgi:hypothetical protein